MVDSQTRTPREREKFYSKVRKCPETGCHLWTGSKTNGYGLGGRGGRELAQRVALELVGVDLSDKRVRHLCGTKLCVNPEHLVAETSADRFWKFVVMNETTGCHEWTGSKTSQGYGHFRGFPGEVKNTKAHRFALHLAGVQVPDDRVVMHSCDNPSCVNVDHLRIATVRDNNEDKARKGRGNHGALPYGVAATASGKFVARITRSGEKSICLGTFKTVEAAAAVARCWKERRYGITPAEPENPYEGAEWGDHESARTTYSEDYL